MPFCAHCGHQISSDAAFCAHCGRPVQAQAPQTTPEPTTPEPTAPIAAAPPQQPTVVRDPARAPLPPPAAPAAPAMRTPGAGGFDWQRLLRGNWLGSGLVAVTALGASGVLATLIALMVKPPDFGVDNSLTLVAFLMTGAFGASLSAKLSTDTGFFDASITASVGAIALTITILTLLATVLVFRRVTRDYPRGVDALGDAVRAALLTGLGLMVVAIAFRSDGDKFGRGWGGELAQMFDTDIKFGPSIAGALILGFLVVLLVLAVDTLLRGRAWPVRVEQARDWLAAPLAGVGVFALLLPLVGLLALLLVSLTGDTVSDSDPTNDDLWASIGLVLALLANGGFWYAGLGTGAGFGARGRSTEGDSSEVHHLGHYAGDSWGMWFAPVVMLGLMLVCALAVARRSAPESRLRSLGVWVALVLVTTPLWAVLSGLRAHMGVASGGQSFSGRGSIGLVGWQVTLLLTLAAAVCALVVALWTKSLTTTQLRADARSLGQRVQSNPGRPTGPQSAPPPPPPT